MIDVESRVIFGSLVVPEPRVGSVAPGAPSNSSRMQYSIQDPETRKQFGMRFQGQ